MNLGLKVFLIVFVLGFLATISKMIRRKYLELNYSIVWLLAGVFFLVLAVFDKTLGFISNLIFIKEPVNALFLMVLFFVIMMLLVLTVALSRASRKIVDLSQELAFIKKVCIEENSDSVQQGGFVCTEEKSE